MNDGSTRKVIVCMGIGGPYEAQLRATQPFREEYARRHGWDTVNITELHPRAAAELTHLPFALRTHLSKLLVPNELREQYDLVMFVEADTFIHPQAPCISPFAEYIPAGGFAAVADHLPQERGPLFGWSDDHYSTLSQQWKTKLPSMSDWDRAVNGGVQLYRPAEIADRWLSHFENNGGNSDENVLNLTDVQNGLVYFLPSEWNRVWYYEKFRLGLLHPENNRITKIRNRILTKVLWRYLPQFERRMFQRHFPVAHIHHLAFEGNKVVDIAAHLRRTVLTAAHLDDVDLDRDRGAAERSGTARLGT